MRSIGERLKKVSPNLLSFAHNSNIKVPVLKKKLVVRGYFRPPENDRAFRQLKLDLLCQKKTSLHIPHIATHPDDVGFSIHYKFKDGLIASVAHQMPWQELCINTLVRSNPLEVGRSKRDVFIAEKEIMGLDGKLK
jgi:hypothetical protein